MPSSSVYKHVEILTIFIIILRLPVLSWLFLDRVAADLTHSFSLAIQLLIALCKKMLLHRVLLGVIAHANDISAETIKSSWSIFSYFWAEKLLWRISWISKIKIRLKQLECFFVDMILLVTCKVKNVCKKGTCHILAWMFYIWIIDKGMLSLCNFNLLWSYRVQRLHKQNVHSIKDDLNDISRLSDSFNFCDISLFDRLNRIFSFLDCLKFLLRRHLWILQKL